MRAALLLSVWRKGAAVFAQCGGSAGGGPEALGVRRWGSNNKVRASLCGQQGEAERLNLSLRLWLKRSDERCRGGGGVRLSFHVHALVCRYNLPLAKPLTLSLPLTPNEVRLVGRTNIIYEIAGCTGRGKGEC